MVFLNFPTKLTQEELLLQQKYAQLRKKKKALERYQAPVKVEPAVSNPLMRPLDPKDAKDYAKKLIRTGKITVPNKGPETKTVFRRPGLQRKFTESRSSSSAAAEAVSLYPSYSYSSTTASASEPSDPKLARTAEKYRDFQAVEMESSHAESGFQYEPFTPSVAAHSEVSKSESPSKYRDRPIVIARRKRVLSSASEETEGPRRGHTVYVKGRHLDEQLCTELFGKIGNVVHVAMDVEHDCAFVTFDYIESAEKAIAQLNGISIRDVQIEVSFARRQVVVPELVDDTPVTGTWTALASNQSLNGTHQDKRKQLVYETEDDVMELSP